jgi:hypothetical protein
LATDGKTPLREAATSSSGRSQKTAQRSKVARRRALVGVGVGILVVVGLFFLFGRGGDSIIGGQTEPPPPEFLFHQKGASYEATQIDGKKSAMQATAQQVGGTMRTQLDKLFLTSYLDRETWGDPGEIEDFFTDEAKAHLEADAGVLTLGANASDTYTYVQPERSTVVAKVLTDKDGTALRALSSVDFVAVATHKDGTYTRINVTGAFFFVKDGGAWRIEGYRLNKTEKPTKAPSATPTHAPGSEAS